MDFSFTPEQQQLRREFRSFFGTHVTRELQQQVAASGSEHSPEFHKLLGSSGLIGLQWPVEFGGRGLGPIEGAILQDEAALAGAPILASGVNAMIGYTLIAHGTEEQRQRLLPDLVRGSVVYALAYTEPDAGSDLAALKTRAKRDGDDWVITGHKMFSSRADVADFLFCAVRTDPSAPKHAGISIIIVPTDQVDIEPVWTMGGFQTNSIFLESVRVPTANVVGTLNHGWEVLRTALDFERASTIRTGQCKRLHMLICRTLGRTNRFTSNDVIGRTLAELKIEIAAAESLAYKVAWLQSRNESATTIASMTKIIATELAQKIANFGLDVCGPGSELGEGAVGAPANGQFEFEFRDAVRFTVTAGVNEIQRNIVAQRGLGLPR